MSKKILFATFGSLGDLHPYIALALELKRRGHQPVIASFALYREAVQAEGIAFAPMRPDIERFGDKAAIVRRLFSSNSGAAFMVRDMFMPHIRDSYADLNAAAADCDLIVTHPVGFAGPLVAQKRGLPWVSSILAPMSLMSCSDPPLIGPAPWLQPVRKWGAAPYRAAFGLVKFIGRQWEKPYHALRAELALPPAPAAQFEGQYSPHCNLALFSPLLATPQADWPRNTVLCGFPRYDGKPADAGETTRLQQFLQAGDAPLVFGLGSSAVLVAGDFWRHAIAAAQLLGRRAILLTGVPPQQLAEPLGALPPTVQAYEYLPYSTVFPHAAVVIHQAGIGTLAQAMAAGRPQLIVPVAFDQPDNAARAVALGIARSVPFKKVTPQRLAAELRPLLGERAYAARATEIAAAIARENPLATACDLMEAQASSQLSLQLSSPSNQTQS